MVDNGHNHGIIMVNDGIRWVKQCHKLSVTGNGTNPWNTTYKNGNDWGMVYGNDLPTLGQLHRITIAIVGTYLYYSFALRHHLVKSANDCLNRQNDSDDAKEARDGWAQGILNKCVYTTRVFYRIIYIYIHAEKRERERKNKEINTYICQYIYIYIYT